MLSLPGALLSLVILSEAKNLSAVSRRNLTRVSPSHNHTETTSSGIIPTLSISHTSRQATTTCSNAQLLHAKPIPPTGHQ